MFEFGKNWLNYNRSLNENKIVLEIKKGNYFSPNNIKQISAYLRATNLKLGLLANFTSGGVKIKRIVNIL